MSQQPLRPRSFPSSQLNPFTFLPGQFKQGSAQFVLKCCQLIKFVESQLLENGIPPPPPLSHFYPPFPRTGSHSPFIPTNTVYPY